MPQIKTDQPPFRMRIENGHLVPATQFDAERLDTFRASKELLVYPTQQPNNKLIAKFHAVLHEVIKSCPTPWRDVEVAKSAIKLALGKVKPFKSLSGQWRHEPRSLTEFTDTELSEFFDDAMALLEKLTGVDPLTLKAESASVDAPDDQNTDAPPPASDQEAADMSSADASTEGGEVPPPASPPSADSKMIECAKKLLDIAKDETMTPQVRRGVLAEAKDDWKGHLPKDKHEQLKAIFQSADAVIRGDTSHESAVGFFAEALGCKPEDIGGVAG